MKLSVVTTFHQRGLEQYAQKMINTFSETWPAEIDLYLYPENCKPTLPIRSNIFVTELETVESLNIFKNQWKDVPKANGDVSDDPRRSKRRDSGKGFKWDAVRFAHKVYSIFDCANKIDSDFLLWMDADTICHSPITMSRLNQLIPDDRDLCYLGREAKYSECGLYAMNLRSAMTRKFLDEFRRVYDDAERGIFLMNEWHDSFVFDVVRKRFPKLRSLNWSKNLTDLRPKPGSSKGEGHPLINSAWGAYLDHLKGERKELGKSKRDDLKVRRTEPYWQQFN
jgi:hypothetical protein